MHVKTTFFLLPGACYSHRWQSRRTWRPPGQSMAYRGPSRNHPGSTQWTNHHHRRQRRCYIRHTACIGPCGPVQYQGKSWLQVELPTARSCDRIPLGPRACVRRRSHYSLIYPRYNHTGFIYKRGLKHDISLPWGIASPYGLTSSSYVLINIASDSGLLPVRRQAILANNAHLLLIGPLEINFSKI